MRPSPSDDFLRRKMPFRKSVRLPRPKTREIVLNFVSAGDKIQKHRAEAAKVK